MPDILLEGPQTKEAQSDPWKISTAVETLADVLSVRIGLLLNLKPVTGTSPPHYPLHEMTKHQCIDVFAAADALAGRIHGLGHAGFREPREPTADGSGAGETRVAKKMVKDLIADHEDLAARLRTRVEEPEIEGDPVTAKLATGRAAFHERAAWMLRATVM